MPAMPPSLFAGFILGFSLIMAIGSQNAFVLRQGLRRQHVFWICLTCATSDALLITGGVMGFGSLTLLWPWFEQAMRWGGAAFLIWYGARSLLAAWRGGESLEAEASTGAGTGAGATVLPVLATVLALTWLNPHVYLDTVVLLGSISAQYPQPLWFGIGAALASFTFFFSLGYGAAALAPLFARPRAWQILDLLVGLTMWAIAVRLLLM